MRHSLAIAYSEQSVWWTGSTVIRATMDQGYVIGKQRLTSTKEVSSTNAQHTYGVLVTYSYF